MKLKELQISRRHPWEERSGELHGKARFVCEKGEVTVSLSEEAAAKIVDLCADGIIEQATKVATAMVAPLIEAEDIKQIEGE